MSRERSRTSSSSALVPHAPRVFLMDLWATVPYYTAYLARALRSVGLDVQVGSITYYLDRTCFADRGLQVDPGCLDRVGRMNLSPGPRRALKFAEALANMAALGLRWFRRAPDVVHVQYLPLLRYGLPVERWLLALARRRGAQLVLTVHDLLPHDTGERFYAVFQRLYRSMDALICHSEPIRARLIAEFGIAAERITVIPHGPFFYDLPGEAHPTGRGEQAETPVHRAAGFSVLWQGIVLPYKGVDVLLEAWALVEAAAPDATLHIAGPCKPAEAAALASQAAQLGLRRVRFDHRFLPVAELASLYRDADAVVFPYRSITTSGALATALALGSTIVASDLPVFRGELRDGETALLVPPEDPRAVSQALLRLRSDAALRSRLAANVRALDFGGKVWEAIAAATADVYRSLLAPGTGTATEAPPHG